MKFNIISHELPTPHNLNDTTYYYEVEIFFYNDISKKTCDDIVKWHEENIKYKHMFRSSTFSICIRYTNLEDVMAFKLWFS